MISSTPRSLCCDRSRPAPVRASVLVRAFESGVARRQALAGLALALLPSLPKPAIAYDKDAYQTCVLQDSEEAADACRRKVIDELKKNPDYQAASKRDKFVSVSGVPVSVLDEGYVKASRSLMDDMELYCSLAPADRERVALVKKIKKEGTEWVSKYARGGSARTQSARRLYIAVDGVVGFLASNGLAPFPKAKITSTLSVIEQAKALLDAGK